MCHCGPRTLPYSHVVCLGLFESGFFEPTQRNAETAKLQEDAAARSEQERLRIEQQIQAERRAAEQYAVS